MRKWNAKTVATLLDGISAGWRLPPIAVETGTFRGDSALKLSPLFRQWYTIDINPGFSQLAKKRCLDAGRGNVHFVVGDSAVALSRVLSGIAEPVVVFLDAHYSVVRDKKFEQEPMLPHRVGADFPLWSELDTLAEREYPDLVVVDDWELAGREVPVLRAEGDSSPQWEALTVEGVATRLGRVLRARALLGTMVFYRR